MRKKALINEKISINPNLYTNLNTAFLAPNGKTKKMSTQQMIDSELKYILYAITNVKFMKNSQQLFAIYNKLSYLCKSLQNINDNHRLIYTTMIVV